MNISSFTPVPATRQLSLEQLDCLAGIDQVGTPLMSPTFLSTLFAQNSAGFVEVDVSEVLVTSIIHLPMGMRKQVSFSGTAPFRVYCSNGYYLHQYMTCQSGEVYAPPTDYFGFVFLEPCRLTVGKHCSDVFKDTFI